MVEELKFIEGDIFRIIVPLNDGYLEDIAIQSATQTTQLTTQTTQSAARYVNEEPIQAIIDIDRIRSFSFSKTNGRNIMFESEYIKVLS